jgi:glutamine cyclotransferase
MFAVVLILSILTVFSKSNSKKKGLADTSSDFTLITAIKRTETYYTQGMFFDGDILYESGGLYRQSVLVKQDYPSLRLLKKVKLADKYFAEGIARCGNYVYQLTWKERAVLQYNLEDLRKLNTLRMPSQLSEGWGLSDFKDNQLIASDGSSKVYIISCEGFRVKSVLTIKQDGRNISYLNALAYDGEFIYSNVYMDKVILKIDPNTGNVIKRYDMQHLIDYELDHGTLTSFRLRNGYVLNGIAYHKSSQTFLVTGKKWGFYYNITFN